MRCTRSRGRSSRQATRGPHRMSSSRTMAAKEQTTTLPGSPLMRRGLAWIVALAAALAATAPGAPRACFNAVAETDTSVAAVKEAERILNDGDPAEARARA